MVVGWLILKGSVVEERILVVSTVSYKGADQDVHNGSDEQS